MNWKKSIHDLPVSERLKLLISAVQSFGAFGMFIIALIGIWKVTPIITYQTYQIEEEQERKQKASRETKTFPPYTTAAELFVDSAHEWWSTQISRHQDMMDLIDAREREGLTLTYEIITSTNAEPDRLILTARDAAHNETVVSIPVNAKAMPPSQYIQREINRGAFSDLEPPRRVKVENAIARYMKECMLPKVPAVYVREGMSLDEIGKQIALGQEHRRKALMHIKALKGIIDAAAGSARTDEAS